MCNKNVMYISEKYQEKYQFTGRLFNNDNAISVQTNIVNYKYTFPHFSHHKMIILHHAMRRKCIVSLVKERGTFRKKRISGRASSSTLIAP